MKKLKYILPLLLLFTYSAFGQKKNFTIQASDWKNKSFGSELPSWLLDTDTLNFTAIKAKNNLTEKLLVVIYSENKNLNEAQKNADSFEYTPLLAKKIHTLLTDDKIKLEELNLKAENLRLSGFYKIEDTWIKTFTTDNDNKKTKESYTAASIYAINKNDFTTMLSFYLENLKEFLPHLTKEKTQNAINKMLLNDYLFYADSL